MGIQEAVHVEPTGEAIITARRRLLDGSIEPAIDLYPGHTSDNVEPGTEVFVAIDADPFYGHRPLGVIGLHAFKQKGAALLEVFSTGGLDSDPASLSEVVQALFEVRQVEEAIIAHTNLPPDVLRKAGAVALPQGSLEFRAAA